MEQRLHHTEASNGSEAIELAFANPPDLILVDVMMPIMDGFEICRRIRENVLTKYVPVIFITGKKEIKDEELGFAVGASDFIHKPISAPIVVTRVRQQLKIKFMHAYLRGELARLQGNAGDVKQRATLSRLGVETAFNSFHLSM